VSAVASEATDRFLIRFFRQFDDLGPLVHGNLLQNLSIGQLGCSLGSVEKSRQTLFFQEITPMSLSIISICKIFIILNSGVAHAAPHG
jgi:hypothetical protein